MGHTPDTDCDLLIAGAGAAGLTMALAAAQKGWRVGLIDPGPLTQPAQAKPATAQGDARTTAVMASGVRMLNKLGVWEALAPLSAPLSYLELVDDSTGSALHQRFDASEIGQDWFAQNIPNEALKNALRGALAAFVNVTLMPENRVMAISDRDDHLQLESQQGRVSARLLIAADGHRSACRDMLKLPVSQSTARETALVFNTDHEGNHAGISYEFHGPLGLPPSLPVTGMKAQTAQVTTIPLPGHRSAINVVGHAAAMTALAGLDGKALQAAVTEATRGKLGSITNAEAPIAYPIRPFRARRLSASRAVLIGEAAHALPPIGAQGLNTTLADIGVLIDLMGAPPADDPGRDEVTRQYNRARQADIIARSNATGLLSDMVHRGNPVVDHLRRAGLQAVGRIAPLRRQLMARGMAPLGKVPSLMAK